MEWRSRAQCRHAPDGDVQLFDPREVGERTRDAWRRACIAIDTYCSHCPVVEACRSAGEREQGVWGGEFRHERIVYTRDTAPVPWGRSDRQLEPGTHGSIGVGWMAHYRRFRAKTRYRHPSGRRVDVSGYGLTEREAIANLHAKLGSLDARPARDGCHR